MTEALVAQIAADPDDDNAYLVYADWLQSVGDPLGELIVLDHRIANGEDIVPQRWQHLEQHRHSLLGAMGYRLDVFERSPRKLGFLRALPRDELTGWLTAPVARFAISIVAESLDAVTALEISSARPPLRSLALKTNDAIDLDWVWARFPYLERFELDGNARLDGIEALNARTLWLGDNGLPLDESAAAAVAAAAWPALESLRIGFIGSDAVLAPLLTGERAPRLQRLAIVRYQESLDALAELIAGAPIVAQLRSLELASWHRLEGGSVALAAAADRFQHLEVFDVSLGRGVARADRQRLKALIKPDPARPKARAFADGF